MEQRAAPLRVPCRTLWGKPPTARERAFTLLAQFSAGPCHRVEAMTYARAQRQHEGLEAGVTGRADRSSAYAELVSGLLEARHDAASGRFDAEIAAAEADGRIDERTARVLRWWQRESVRAVVEHARSVIPPALGALDEADEE